MTEVRHDEAAAHRFSTEVDGQRAVLDYTLVDDVMTITHTGVTAAIGGRGIAGELMRAALRWPANRTGKSFRPVPMRRPTCASTGATTPLRDATRR